MKGPIIIHICKKEGFPLLSALITPIGFIVLKKLERDMAEETHILLKNPYN